MNPRVCAIILDYFGADKTKECVSSLVGQHLETVFILDNSGYPRATEQLQRSLAECANTDAEFRIQILAAGKNLGFAKGVNFVLAHDRCSGAPHDYYLLLNNDALAGPGLVASMLAEFQRDSAVALVAPRILCSDPGRELGIWYHRYFGLLLSRPGLGRFHYFTGCCLLFPRHLVTESGIFDASFFMYGEDVELGWRLARQRKKIICANTVFARHDLGPSVKRATFFYEYHMVRSHLRLSFRTRLRTAETPLLFLAKYATLSCRAAVRSLKYRTLTPMIAFLLAPFPLRVETPHNDGDKYNGRIL